MVHVFTDDRRKKHTQSVAGDVPTILPQSRIVEYYLTIHKVLYQAVHELIQ
jgi:hypothetical protein